MNRASADAAAAMLDFQAVMQQFLDLQRAVAGTQSRRVADRSAQPESAPATAPEPAPAQRVSRDEPPAAVVATSACGRYRVVVGDRPPGSRRASIARGHAIVLTDDRRGIASALGERLRAEGYPVAVAEAEIIETAAAADRLVAAVVERHGPLAAVVHLAPLATAPAWDTEDLESVWARIEREVRTLFLLAQATGADLNRAAGEGGAVVLACTGMGGAFGYGSDGRCTPAAFPGQAGVAGFAKCLAIEWPDVRVRAVDLDPSATADVLAAGVFDELWSDDRATEVGRVGGRRVGLDIEAAPAAIDAAFDLPGDAVILATGGARGITADVCLELAERHQPTFVVVGQSPLPPALEPSDVAGLTEPAEIRRALVARLQTSGPRATPAVVEKAYRQLEKGREIRRNLGALSAAGARVHYVPLDVCDPAAFGALIDDIYATYGRLDGVIHGAGVIEDKLVRDKSLDSFERVLRTKALSAFVLSRRLRPESLRFLVCFTSVAGRFGNRGQSDYGAANEIVSRLAVALNDRWPGRVCAIGWAPWDKRGMVSAELKREFERRGVDLVSPAAGRRACWQEIQQAGTAPAEIVVGGSAAPVRLATGAPAVAREPLPLLRHASRDQAPAGTVRFSRRLDVSVDRYLDDHRLDGRPVLPLAVACELMAEAAQAAWPDLTVVAVRSLQLLKGIVLEDGPLPIAVTVHSAVHGDDSELTEADVDISTPSLNPAVRYRAVVQLARRPPEAPSFEPLAVSLAPLPVPLDRAYREWTFHGPAFRRVTQIAGLSSDALAGTILSPTDVPVLAGVASPEWIIDPFVFDAALQMLLIWSRATNDMTALPSRFRRFQRFGSLSNRPITCHVAIESSAGGHALTIDIQFVDPDGRVVALLQGMEASCSAALNRLTERQPDPARAGA